MKSRNPIGLAVILTFSAALAQAEETTQAHIIRAAPDPNGVDLVTGGLYVAEPGITAPAAGKMQHSVGRSDRGNEIDNLRVSLESSDVVPEQAWPRLFSISSNGMSSRFWCDEYMNCDEYAPKKGATLELVGTRDDPAAFIYTASDGTRTTFTRTVPNWTGMYGSEILYPSGEKLSLQHTLPTVQNPVSTRVITSNLGYTMQIVSGTTETRKLFKGGTGGTLLNTISTAVEDLGPQGSTYTRRLTDDLGRITRIHYERVVNPYCWFGDNNSMSLKWYEDAAGLRTTVNYHRVPNSSPWGFYGTLVVNTIVRNSKTWTYSSDLVGVNWTFTKQITDPTGAIREVGSAPSGYYGPATSPDGCSSGGHAYFGNVTSDKTPLGLTTNYGYYDMQNAYEPADYLSGATFPDGNKLSYEYDDRGNLTKTTEIPKTGGTGHVIYQAAFPATCTNRKTCNLPGWTRNAAAGQTDYTYDPTHGGLLTSLEPVDANNRRRKIWNEYEARNTGSGTIYRLSATHLCSVLANGTNVDCQTAAEQVTRFTYWENTLLPLTVVKTNGTGSLSAMTTNVYDAWGRILSATDPTGVTQYARYDAVGRKTWEISSNGTGSWAVKKKTYDVMDRVVRMDRGWIATPTSTNLQILGTQLTEYDAEGNKIKNSFTDSSLGRVSVEQFSYDAVSRPVCTATRMNPAAFDSTPDACTVGPAGSFDADRITRNFYDLDGRVTKISQGFGALNGGQGIAAVEMTYTNNSKVATRKDGNGNQTSYTYDAYDRPDRVNFADASFERSEHDSAGRLWKFTKRDGQWFTHGYDGASRLTSTSFSNAEPAVTRGYDGQGRLTSIARAGQTLVYDWSDPLGRLAGEIQPAGTISYAYDLADRRTRMTWPGNYWIDYDYNSAGSLWRMRELGVGSGLGLIATWSFDILGRPATLSRGNGVATTVSIDTSDQMLSLSQDAAGTTQDIQYSYQRNAAAQIVSRSSSNGLWTWTPPAGSNENYVPDALNRYSSVAGTSFSYDGRGNLTFDGSRSYTYDFSNHLISVSGGSSPPVALTYDPQGRLLSSALSGNTTRFLYDGQHVVAEYDGAGNLLRRHAHGPGSAMPILSLDGAATAAASASAPNAARWLLVNELRSVVGLSNASGTVAINTYGPFGEPGATNTGRFGFTGQMWLPEIGLYHYRSRVYHPRLGRFMQTDPIGYQDGLNLYAYVSNDPVNGVDPTGTSCTKDEFGQVSCHHDEIKGTLTETQKGELKDTNDAYTKVVQKLVDMDPKKEIVVTLPKPGKDGKPSSEMREVRTTAGALARALIQRHVVIDAGGTGKSSTRAAAETRDRTTTIYASGLSGKYDTVNVKNTSPTLQRWVMFGHEGLHGSGTATDIRWMAGYNTDWLVKHPGFHQIEYNRAAYDVLFR